LRAGRDWNGSCHDGFPVAIRSRKEAAMSRKTRGSDPWRKGLVARDLTATKLAGLKGGVVTDNKDPDRLSRDSVVATGFFRSVGGLKSETE
jgi:hypothetical protein